VRFELGSGFGVPFVVRGGVGEILALGEVVDDERAVAGHDADDLSEGRRENAVIEAAGGGWRRY
jgi:hypothetical protein